MTAAGPIPSAGRSELDRLRQAVATYFPVYETRVGPQSVLFAVHVDRAGLAPKFEEMRRELAGLGYIPILRRQMGEEFIEVIRRPPLGPRHPWINVVLLGATVATTVFAGSMIWLTWVGHSVLTAGDVAYGALYFAAPLLAILGVHETAHFVVARRAHLDASIPYFIPIPPPYILGTFGAFVSIREPFPDRKTLFDVGVAGPLAGFALSIPITFVGLALSLHAPVVPANVCGPSILGQSYGNLIIGPSLIFLGISAFFPASLVSLSPLALAGWVGILITAINLVPAGSLDGGHVFRALAGDRARWVSYAAAAGLFGLGFFYIGWWLFAILVLFLGLRHPPPLNDTSRLDGKRLAVGALAVAILVGGFALVPLSTPAGSVSATAVPAEQITPPPGVAIAAYLNARVTNDDPVVHGYLYTFNVTNVSLSAGTELEGPALAAWEANASWTFLWPNGTRAGPFAGGSATVPAGDFLTLKSGAMVIETVEFTDRETAYSVGFAFAAHQLCASTGGSATTGLGNVTFS